MAKGTPPRNKDSQGVAPHDAVHAHLVIPPVHCERVCLHDPTPIRGNPRRIPSSAAGSRCIPLRLARRLHLTASGARRSSSLSIGPRPPAPSVSPGGPI